MFFFFTKNQNLRKKNFFGGRGGGGGVEGWPRRGWARVSDFFTKSPNLKLKIKKKNWGVGGLE